MEVTWAGHIQIKDSIIDLTDLHRGVNQNSKIIQAKPDDLDSVLQPQGVVHKDQLIDESENEEREIGRYDFNFGY